MSISLFGRSLLTLLDFSPEEIQYLLELSLQVKTDEKKGKKYRRFEGKTLAMLFEKRSTRTRCAFETALGEEGGHPVFLSSADIHLGVKEELEDTARVFGRMFSAIMFRGFKQKTAETLAKYSGVPVYNGLTDQYHPTQALADFLTLMENFGKVKGLTLCYVGDGRNNVARSLMIISSLLGTNFTVITPPELNPDSVILQNCTALAEVSNAIIKVTPDISAVLGADAIYTDVWTSMGEEDKKEERVKLLSPYQVNQKLMNMTAKPSTIFLHCLPAVKGEEVTAEVIEGQQSRVWDEAENRKHTIKAVMLATLIK
ncbi:ornithine carbamoyltransferase [Treponema sp. R6D11]